VRASVARHTATEEAFGYGYQWWTHDRIGAFFARGRAGQLIVVIPRYALIVVFTANVSDDQVLFDLIDEFVLPAVQDEKARDQ
jgi:CubicO group peptidase (beta-lactamase class C family)